MNGVRAKSLTTVTTLAALVLLLPLGTPAATGQDVTLGAEFHSEVVYPEQCLKAAAVAGQDRELCRTVIGHAASAPEVASVEDIVADPGLSPDERSELVRAAATSVVNSRYFNQWTTGVSYQRSQRGKAYYNGSRVWITSSYSGYTGYHICWTNYAVGVTISPQACSDSGTTSLRTLQNVWNVTYGFFTYAFSQSMTVSRNGAVTGTNAS